MVSLRDQRRMRKCTQLLRRHRLALSILETLHSLAHLDIPCLSLDLAAFAAFATIAALSLDALGHASHALLQQY